jgi:putative lipoprotein
MVVALLSAACGEEPAGDDRMNATSPITISGSAAYRQRIALPPDATVIVTLEDISRADAAAEKLAETRIATQGAQVPIPFTLTVDRSALDPRYTYSVRVRIRDADGNLMWTTDTVHRVPGDPDSDQVDLGTLWLIQIDRAAARDDSAGSAITGVEWLVEDIGGRDVVDDTRPTVLLDTDGKIAGQAPCNRYTGSYELEGSVFGTSDIAVTARACPEPIGVQEVEFLAILRSAAALELTDEGRLVLSTATGESITARRPDEAP